MTRIVKEYAVRREEILESAQRLIYAQGYERMTIRDILDDLQISNGAFYHYFTSKPALLEALVGHMVEQAEQIWLAVVKDETISALAKLQMLFDATGRWKTRQKDYHLALLRTWYADDNAAVRLKLRTVWIARLKPLLAEVIEQGQQEGTFETTYPEPMSGVVLALLQELIDTIAAQFLALEHGREDLPTLENTANAYAHALERILGAPANTFTLVDASTLKEWVDAFQV